MQDMQDSTIEHIRKARYEEYRLEWMLAHGYTLTDLMAALEKVWLTTPFTSLAPVFDAFEKESGFNGEIWASYDEWCGNECWKFTLRTPDDPPGQMEVPENVAEMSFEDNLRKNGRVFAVIKGGIK